MVEDYLKGDFMGLGYRLGKAMDDASHDGPPPEVFETPMPQPIGDDPRREYYEK